MNLSAHMDQLRNLLTKTCSARSLLLHETKTKRTLSCSAFFNTAWVLEESGKTVVVYSLGDGKSRILTFTCLAGLKTGMFKKVYLVFGNKHLMERDRADFKDLWRLAGCVD